ncbi:hypothetical protein FRX31_003345, partial [Thalictrum thalictroides]
MTIKTLEDKVSDLTERLDNLHELFRKNNEVMLKEFKEFLNGHQAQQPVAALHQPQRDD